jgi:hypothetical protein
MARFIYKKKGNFRHAAFKRFAIPGLEPGSPINIFPEQHKNSRWPSKSKLYN